MKKFSDEERALLTAIHAQPREDTPWLVYADWLQEHEQPEYAEFIRLSIHNEAHEIIMDRRTCLAPRRFWSG